MKILLISPNTLTAPYPVYPIGLDYVAGALPERHEIRIADMNVVSLEKLGDMLTDFAPEIIGLSFRNVDNTDAAESLYFIREYRNLVSWLRERTDAVLVCGGSGFTIMPDQIFRALEIDYGVVGEGERFALLIEALQNGKDPTGIPGVLASTGSRVMAAPWDGERVRRFRHDADHLEFYLKRGGMLNLQSKRGCAFSCIYCPYPNIEGKKHRLTPPEEVARTALQLQDAGARYFFVTDSAFNSDVAHSLAVATAFKKAGVAIPWGGFFAPLKPPQDYFAVMADAGLTHVEFGTESMSSSMLKTYRKPFQVGDVIEAHRQAKDAGLHVAHYFLLGGPGEMEATVMESLDNIESLKQAVFFLFVGIRIYPRTALYEMALAEGSITPDTDLLEPVYYESDGISRAAIETLVTRRANRRMNWVIGSGGELGAAAVRMLHDWGYTGPLWEQLAR